MFRTHSIDNNKVGYRLGVRLSAKVLYFIQLQRLFNSPHYQDQNSAGLQGESESRQAILCLIASPPLPQSKWPNEAHTHLRAGAPIYRLLKRWCGEQVPA